MTNTQELQAHRLAKLIPPMSEQEFVELRDDISENGLQTPITLYEGQILDGRHRARACAELGIEPEMREYEGDDPRTYILSANVNRRHLTITQKALIVLEVLPAYKKRAKQRKVEGARLAGQSSAPGRPAERSGSVEPDLSDKRARAEAAEKIGIGGATVGRLERVRDQAPDLFEQVKDGAITVRGAEGALRKRLAPTDGKPSPKASPDTKRGRQLMNGARKRVETAVGTCNGLARGLGHLRVDWAMSVA
ncbi:MAG: ParB N-terminal domain-containing protein, partial [Solirubrobacteraceae bacterium]